MHGLTDMPGSDGGIVIRQGFDNVTMAAGERLHGGSGARGWKAQP
jgi:hypothetical protein